MARAAALRIGRARLERPRSRRGARCGGAGGGGSACRRGRAGRRRTAQDEPATVEPRMSAGTGRDAIVSPETVDDEQVVEAALRPKALEEFVGQERVREQLSLVLDAACRRGRPPDHVLLSGSPGL